MGDSPQIDAVRRFFADADSAAVAFSGGVDSSLLLDIAREVLGGKALAVTVASPLVPSAEIEEAARFCRERGIKHEIAVFDPFAIPGFAANPPDRCYICKRAVFSLVKDVASKHGIAAVADGTCADDSGDYRPGARALAELGVASPLRDAGIGKTAIRGEARARGIAACDKPSSPCLASRFAYGERITPEALERIGKAETYLKDIAAGLSPAGTFPPQIRVRYCAGEARIETEPPFAEMFAAKGSEIASAFRKLGFSRAVLDLQGYRTGSLNESLPREILDAAASPAANGRVPPDDLGFACVDIDRARRQGAPESIYGAGKTAPQIVAILRSLSARGQTPVLVTRIDAEKSAAVAAEFPGWRYFPEARLGRLGEARRPDGCGEIAVVCAGTSDIPVAEEAALVAETLGSRVRRVYDVGVAGIHRLLDKEDVLRRARVVIAVAGMEGALPSVVGGLVSCPVIAVPTSVGYGTSFGGVTALLAMLNSCAAGISVVNIDNGFGAGFLAHRIDCGGR